MYIPHVYTHTGQVSTVLHNVEVEIVSREECASAYFNDTATRPFFEIDYPDGVTPVVLCAGKINNVCRVRLYNTCVCCFSDNLL